ncbi:MAG: hypothetical protein GEU95_13325 [Rhizobiales bacterium]|nr:hypothetical protein [Hyphomicrobiales bacterium]
MNIKTKLILATTAVALLSAPASARIEGDEGGASAFPRFNSERDRTNAASAYASGYIVQPGYTTQRQHRVRQSRPHRYR